MPNEVEFTAAAFEAADFEAAEFLPADMESDDPLSALPYTGDPESDSKSELGALKEGFARRAEKENLRRQKATDSEYWVCLCFQTREQAIAFARGAGGRSQDKYMDGRKVAARLGIPIPIDDIGFGKPRIDRTFAGLPNIVP